MSSVWPKQIWSSSSKLQHFCIAKTFTFAYFNFWWDLFPVIFQLYDYESPSSYSKVVEMSTEESANLPKKLQNDSKKAYNCNQCSYTSNVSTNFNAHMLDHNGEKSFACRQCNYSTKTAGCLKLHLRTHSGEKHFSCTQCNYSSTQAVYSRDIWWEIQEKSLLVAVCSFTGLT